MKALNFVVLTCIIIGALNWGLIGFFGFDLITSVFGGSMFWIARVLFALVGLAGLYALTFYSNVGESQGMNGVRHSKQH